MQVHAKHAQEHMHTQRQVTELIVKANVINFALSMQ